VKDAKSILLISVSKMAELGIDAIWSVTFKYYIARLKYRELKDVRRFAISCVISDNDNDNK